LTDETRQEPTRPTQRRCCRWKASVSLCRIKTTHHCQTAIVQDRINFALLSSIKLWLLIIEFLSVYFWLFSFFSFSQSFCRYSCCHFIFGWNKKSRNKILFVFAQSHITIIVILHITKKGLVIYFLLLRLLIFFF
jgi:hypothetical protein